jgi:hypothetical protein
MKNGIIYHQYNHPRNQPVQQIVQVDIRNCKKEQQIMVQERSEL